MRRGTLAVFGRAPQLLGTFKPSGVGRPLYLRLYLAALRRHGFPVPAGLEDDEYRLFGGDLLTVGKGEVLVRHEAA
jgi:formylmethanofuran dehydrogenase subunit C